jgi:hypothetical protein
VETRSHVFFEIKIILFTNSAKSMIVAWQWCLNLILHSR